MISVFCSTLDKFALAKQALYCSYPGAKYKVKAGTAYRQQITYFKATHKLISMAERKTSSTNYSNQVFLEEKCSLNELINLLSKRWITEVLFSIEEGNTRFSAIRSDLVCISDNVLADRLRLLEEHKLISRQSFPEMPPRVEYALTPTGEELSRLLEQLCTFSEQKLGF
jgi:DNA-binding HxlR family transcriptional regulator